MPPAASRLATNAMPSGIAVHRTPPHILPACGGYFKAWFRGEAGAEEQGRGSEKIDGRVLSR